jgi:hypothetical protein
MSDRDAAADKVGVAAAGPAVTLAVGLVLGLALGSRRPASRRRAVRDPASVRPAIPIVVRPTASSACLETARRADEVTNLLITSRRSRAAEVLVAYTVPSRQCRRDAAP